PAAPARAYGRAASLQRPRCRERVRLASVTVTRAGALRAKAKPTREMLSRARFRARNALLVSARADTLATVARGGAGESTGVGLGPATGCPDAPAAAAPAPPPPPALPVALVLSAPPGPSVDWPGSWKAPVPAGVPTPLGPS